MNSELKFGVSPTKAAPTAAVERVEPHLFTDCAKCEGNLNIGIFFDGTNNNRDADIDGLKHTNVARLYDTYLRSIAKGYYPRYIPGVGTPFPEIRENGESDMGSGFGMGCEQRVLYALLHVFNSLHRGASGDAALLTDQQVAALCCNSIVQGLRNNADTVALGMLGQFGGLLMPVAGQGMRVQILRDLAKRLEAALVKGRPHIKECFIDVFGFSRGAAQARVFCNWLDEILVDAKLAGVIVHFRFLGVMDTVASAGVISCVGAKITGTNGGHSGWAESRFLRVPASVLDCVHMIAAHELRTNFPLDTITVDGKLPAHLQEFVYPGTHSDVGGGYAPGELGIAFDADVHKADAQKLSQIPLNHMLDCAIAAGAPMNRSRAAVTETAYDPFAIAPVAQKAYDDFVICSPPTPRPVHEWLQPYLNWRWEVRMHYGLLNQVMKANPNDRALLTANNARLIADADYLASAPKTPSLLSTLVMPARAAIRYLDAARSQLFEDEARTVLAIAKAAPTTEARLRQLFDLFVHDSLAGFDKNALELSGYWRYRRGYLGNERPVIAQNDTAGGDSRSAA